MSDIPDVDTMPGVPIQVIITREGGTSEVWHTRSVWHRDGKGYGTGDVLVSSRADEGWSLVHQTRAAQILGTDLVYEVGRVIKADRNVVTSQWAVAEEGGWND